MKFNESVEEFSRGQRQPRRALRRGSRVSYTCVTLCCVVRDLLLSPAKCGVNSSVAKHAELVRRVDLRPDDVLTVGFPRSGNHWAFEMVHMVLNQTTDFAESTYYQAFIDSIGDDINNILSERPSPRILPSHKRISCIPDQAIENKIKIIYVIRNPKDVLASLYRLMSGLTDEAAKYTGTWDEFFTLQMAGEFPWGSWFDHVLTAEQFIRDHPECPVYVHVYEEVKTNPVDKVKDVCTFLGKPSAIAEDIAARTEFSTMKKSLLAGKMKQEMDEFMQHENIVFRTGLVGDWKNRFTVAQNEIFRRKFEEKMAGSKLGELFGSYL